MLGRHAPLLAPEFWLRVLSLRSRGFPRPGTQTDVECFVCSCPGQPKHSRCLVGARKRSTPTTRCHLARFGSLVTPAAGAGAAQMCGGVHRVWLMHVAAQVDKRERPESGVAGLQVDGDSRMRGELRTAGSAGGAPAPPPRQAHADVYEPARGVLSFSPASRWKRLLRPTRHHHANLCGGRETRFCKRCARSKRHEESELEFML